MNTARVSNRRFAKIVFYSLFCASSLVIGLVWRIRNVVCRKAERPGRRILVFQFGHLGDLVHTIPLLKNLKLNDKETHVTLVTGPWNVQIADGISWADRIVVYPHPLSDRMREFRLVRFLRELGILLKTVTLEPYDIGMGLNGHINSLAYVYWTNANRKIGFSYRRHGMLLDSAILQDETIHEYEKDRLLLLLPLMGYRTLTSEFDLSHCLSGWSDRGSHPANLSVIGLFPGASVSRKCWGADRFAELADRIVDEGLGRVLIMGGPDDAAMVDSVARLAKSRPQVVVTGSIACAAAAIQGCALFVSNDTGPMHMAVAMGVPTIGLFGPGDSRRWGPREPHVCIWTHVGCSPCDEYDDRCDNPLGECIRQISVATVFDSVARLLGGKEQAAITPPFGGHRDCLARQLDDDDQ